MLREYMVSESMHALSIPTTPLTAVCGTGSPVRPGGVTAGRRVDPGREQSSAGRHLPVRPLRPGPRPPAPPRDHAIMPTTRRGRGLSTRTVPSYDAVVASQAMLIAQWMLVGFQSWSDEHRHMTISGEPSTRTVRLSRRFRTVHGLQLDRPRRPLRVREPASRRRMESGSPREALLPSSTPTRGGGCTRGHIFGDLPAQYTAAWSAGYEPSSPGNDLPEDLVAPLVDELLTLAPRRAPDYTSFFPQP